MNWIVEKAHQIRCWAREGPRRIPGLLAVGCGITLIVLYFWLSAQPAEDTVVGSVPTQTAQVLLTEQQMEQRLSQILSNIDGAGAVSVMITYATGSEIVPALSVDRQSIVDEQTDSDGSTQRSEQESEQSELVTSQQDDSDVVVLTEKMPQILGVVVVAEGADDLYVRMSLMQAVETVLQIPADQVEVFPMQTQQGGGESDVGN